MKAPIVRLTLVREGTVDYRARITGPKEVIRIVSELTKDAATEYLYAVSVDVKNRINHILPVAHGGAAGVSTTISDIVRSAVIAGAYGLILLHNHPSGDVEPSAEDIALTEQVSRACILLGIKFLDHIIVGGGCFYSITQKERGICAG